MAGQTVICVARRTFVGPDGKPREEVYLMEVDTEESYSAATMAQVAEDALAGAGADDPSDEPAA